MNADGFHTFCAYNIEKIQYFTWFYEIRCNGSGLWKRNDDFNNNKVIKSLKTIAHTKALSALTEIIVRDFMRISWTL